MLLCKRELPELWTKSIQRSIQHIYAHRQQSPGAASEVGYVHTYILIIADSDVFGTASPLSGIYFHISWLWAALTRRMHCGRIASWGNIILPPFPVLKAHLKWACRIITSCYSQWEIMGWRSLQLVHFKLHCVLMKMYACETLKTKLHMIKAECPIPFPETTSFSVRQRNPNWNTQVWKDSRQTHDVNSLESLFTDLKLNLSNPPQLTICPFVE